MKRMLRLLSVVLALSAILFWVALGANRGWTKTSVPVKVVDEVTGIEGTHYEKRFVPGVDLLAGALLGTAFLAGLSFVFRNKSSLINKP